MTSSGRVGKLTAVKRPFLPAILAVALVSGLMAVPARATTPAPQPGFQSIEPARLIDTRTDATPLSAGETRTLDLSSRVPSGATGVALNITGVGANASTAISAWIGDAKRSLTSVITVGPGSMQSNLALLELRDDLTVRFYNYAGSTHLIVDVVGWFTGDFVGMTPVRAVD
ncbi:MAG: hypothetical protein ACKPBG_05740, partial [Actinomycetota bacterium]